MPKVLFPKDLSVVVPTHQPRRLAWTLEGLERQHSKGFKVVLVENGHRSERVRSVVRNFSRRLDLIHVHEPVASLNRARNVGVRCAPGRLIALLDDDCRPEPDWVMQVVRCHNELSDAGVIGGRVTLDFEAPPPAWLVGEFRTCLSELDRGGRVVALEEGGYLVGANLSFRKSVHLEAGGFPESLGMATRQPPQLANDEIAFFDRVRQVSAPALVYAGTMKVRHRIPTSRTSLDAMFQRRFGQGLSDVALLRWRHDNATPALHRRYLDFVFPHPWHRNQFERHLEGLDAEAAGDYRLHHAVCRLAYWLGFVEGLERSRISGDAGAVGWMDCRAARRGRRLAGRFAASAPHSPRNAVVDFLIECMYARKTPPPAQSVLLAMARRKLGLVVGMVRHLYNGDSIRNTYTVPFTRD